MISATTTVASFKRERNWVIKQIDRMREEMEDLRDYLDLLEARARNKGKPTYTAEEVKKKLGIK